MSSSSGSGSISSRTAVVIVVVGGVGEGEVEVGVVGEERSSRSRRGGSTKQLLAVKRSIYKHSEHIKTESIYENS